MRTLVAGAPGWLGTRLVEVLLKGWDGEGGDGRDVRCFVKRGVDSSILKKYGAEVVEGDICDRDSIRVAMKGVDTVFCLTGIIHPRRVKEFYEITTEGTKNLISEAVSNDVRRFIYISSNSPAGCNPDKEALFKNAEENPYMHYGRSKLLAEKAVQQYQKEGKIETVILRPCWFYGPGQPARQTRFFRMIKAGNPIVFGDGENLRSMSYIDNVIQGILLAERLKAANGQIYWIADKRPYKTIEIYRAVAEILNVKNFKPRFVPGIVSEVFMVMDSLIQGVGLYQTEIHVAGEMNKNIACSIEKAEKELGYNPTVDLYEGMKRSIEWCRSNGIDI